MSPFRLEGIADAGLDIGSLVHSGLRMDEVDLSYHHA